MPVLTGWVWIRLRRLQTERLEDGWQGTTGHWNITDRWSTKLHSQLLSSETMHHTPQSLHYTVNIMHNECQILSDIQVSVYVAKKFMENPKNYKKVHLKHLPLDFNSIKLSTWKLITYKLFCCNFAHAFSNRIWSNTYIMLIQLHNSTEYISNICYLQNYLTSTIYNRDLVQLSQKWGPTPPPSMSVIKKFSSVSTKCNTGKFWCNFASHEVHYIRFSLYAMYTDASKGLVKV